MSAATGAPVAGWTYRTQVGANGTLTANESGNANTKGKSATFNADPATSYSVNVHVATATNGCLLARPSSSIWTPPLWSSP